MMTHARAQPSGFTTLGAMNDDWRVRVELHDQGFAHRLGETLEASELEHDLARAYGDRVLVSVDGSEVFLYSADRAQAQAAQALVQRIADEHDWQIETELRHWHAIAELWEDPEVPEPANPAQVASEDAQRNAIERRDSAQEGYPEMEVRIVCGSRHEAGELSDRLAGEGIVNIHRWSWVMIGANDEASANALAQRLRGELPNATITVDTNLRWISDHMPGNPFAILGGLAG